MSLYLQDPDVTLHLGDVRDVLPTLEAESVDCVVTSPPFFGLRDYGTGEWEGGDPGCDHNPPPRQPRSSRPDTHGFGTRSVLAAQDEGVTAYRKVCGRCGARRIDRQIGLEPSPEEWVDELVAVFRGCRRVLRPHGTLWIEVGDSYGSGGSGGSGEASAKQVANRGSYTSAPRSPSLKPKDLLLQPFMLAMALRADGWYLRQVIVWSKPNAMPESVRDRCTTAHSYVLLLSKQPRYWFDADAIAEPAEWARWGDQTVPKYEGTETASGWIKPKTKNELARHAHRREMPSLYAQVEGCPLHDVTYFHGDQERHDGADYPACDDCGDESRLHAPGNRTTNGQKGRTDERRGFDNRLERVDGMKNARSVWQIPTSGYPGAHFATFPEKLVERMLLAGCPEAVCGTCGKARERLTDVTYGKSPVHGGGSTIRKRNEGTDVNGWAGEAMPRLAKHSETLGWSDCGCGTYKPGVVLDPFGGSGTTALVARRLQRRSVLVELNEDYCRMAADRLQQLSLLAEA